LAMAADGCICVVDGWVLAFAGCSSLSPPLSMFVFCVRYSQCSSPGKGMTGGSFKVKAAALHAMFVWKVRGKYLQLMSFSSSSKWWSAAPPPPATWAGASTVTGLGSAMLLSVPADHLLCCIHSLSNIDVLLMSSCAADLATRFTQLCTLLIGMMVLNAYGLSRTSVWSHLAWLWWWIGCRVCLMRMLPVCTRRRSWRPWPTCTGGG